MYKATLAMGQPVVHETIMTGIVAPKERGGLAQKTHTSKGQQEGVKILNQKIK
jgi:hypothetical protein